MTYNISDLKKYIPDIPEIDIKEYISRMEKKELVKYGIIAGAAGALTITTLIIIAKKLKKKKTVQVVEVSTADLADENL